MFLLLISCLLATTITSVRPCCKDDVVQVKVYDCPCNEKGAGILRYHKNKIQFCNGVKYVDLAVTEEVGTKENPALSCKQILAKKKNARSGVYYLKKDSSTFKAYCHMEQICGSRGWTMIMKIDGRKTTFTYASRYWSDKRTYNVAGAAGGLNKVETKLATYWQTPFTKLCLGMKTGRETRWMRLDYEATSLFALIADGRYRPTTKGRNAWKSLISGSSLQLNCNREGFNVNLDTKARIGIVSNQEIDCNTANSRIGYGTAGSICGQNTSNSAGNEARCSPDNGNKGIQSFGYIFAQG